MGLLARSRHGRNRYCSWTGPTQPDQACCTWVGTLAQQVGGGGDATTDEEGVRDGGGAMTGEEEGQGSGVTRWPVGTVYRWATWA